MCWSVSGWAEGGAGDQGYIIMPVLCRLGELANAFIFVLSLVLLLKKEYMRILAALNKPCASMPLV